MFVTRFLICAVGAALARAAPDYRRDTTGSEAKLAATSVPMKVINCGSNNECYRVDVSIGTPPQKYRLTLDNTIYTNIHLFSSKMPTPNSTCTSIGSVSLPSVPASLITILTAPLNPEWDADGFFGTHPPFSPFEESLDTLSAFLAAFQRPSVTFYYARVEYFDQNSNKGGVMTVGGVDTTNCDAKWTTIPSSRAFHGQLMIETFSIKGKTVHSWKFAEPDVTTSYITAPQAAIDAVVKATSAEYDFKTDTFQVDCDKRSSFPDMVFKLPGMDYHLPAVDYARRRSDSSQRCTLMLVPDASGGPPSRGSYWTLGTSFFRPYCTLLDFKAKTFSLAKALH
ncbi:ASP-1 protein [Aphelenchoides avenae]|nr:ASP-1 protein [Aphelenchus avenae]